MGCTSSKAHADEFQEHRRTAKEHARAEKLRQQLPSPVAEGDDLPPWVVRQHEVHTPTREDGFQAKGYRSYGATDAPAYSEKAEQPYR